MKKRGLVGFLILILVSLSACQKASQDDAKTVSKVTSSPIVASQSSSTAPKKQTSQQKSQSQASQATQKTQSQQQNNQESTISNSEVDASTKTSTASSENNQSQTPTEKIDTITGNQAVSKVYTQVGGQYPSQSSYLNNGLIDQGDQKGYLVNIYPPKSTSPVAAYFVNQKTGEVSQVW